MTDDAAPPGGGPYREPAVVEKTPLQLLEERVEKLEKAVARLKKHRHSQRPVSCPKCGRAYSIITKPWRGVQCSCGTDMGEAADLAYPNDDDV